MKAIDHGLQLSEPLKLHIDVGAIAGDLKLQLIDQVGELVELLSRRCGIGMTIATGMTVAT